MTIALKYLIFAVIATVLNLLSQVIMVRIYDGLFYVTLALIVGTGVGLVAKYLLDKRYIFAFYPKSKSDDAKVFMLYTITGVFTTVIFWGAAFGFDAFFGTERMRLVGGALGLFIGYFVKYQLDKRYVFSCS